MSKKVGILGTGVVGQVLAQGFLTHGYSVMVATRDPEALAQKGTWDKAIHIGTHRDVAQWADLLVLATKGSAAEGAIRLCDSADLAGKVIIDTTNPIADAPPTAGVLHYFTTLEESLMERLQRINDRALFVKAFNSVGSALMVNPQFGGTRPTMFICGNDAGAKAEVTAILDQFGWESADMGGVEGARAVEPLCMLWCIPGFASNQWRHAFKLLK